MVKTHRVFVAVLAGLCLALTVPAQAADYEKYIPDDTEAVIQLNFKQMLASPMLKDALGALKGLAGGQNPLKEIGFDPLNDLNQVVIAIPGGGNFDKAVVLVQGKFNVAKFEELVEKSGKADLKVHKVGANKVFEGKLPIPQIGDQTMYFGFVDNTTIAMASSKEGISDTIDRKAGKKKSELKKEMTALLGKMDAKLSMAVAVLGTVAGQAEVSDRIENITGGVSLGNDAKAEFVIATKNAAAAQELESLIGMGLDQAKALLPIIAANQKQLAPLADLINVIKVTTAGNNVTIKGQLTKEEVEKAIKKAGG